MIIELVVLIIVIYSSAEGQDTTSLHEAVFDLSYSYDNTTVHWPTAMGFQFVKVVAQIDSTASWYAMNDFCTGEHSGTHLDAPYHFNRNGMKVGDIPMSKLIAKSYVLDFESLGNGKASANTTLEPRHIQLFEKKVFGEGGSLPADSILLIRFNWGQYYGTEKYFSKVEYDNGQFTLAFPGVGPDAARLLAKRGVVGVGVDVISVDPGYSITYDTHRIFANANIFAMENVNIPSDLLQFNGRFVVYAIPMKIREGTGAPCRILAIVSKKHCRVEE